MPAGVIVFTPDARQGNTGPQGYAAISNGHYSTRERDGGPTSGGPHVVSVQGFNAKPPHGNALFPTYEYEHDFVDHHTTLDLDVPN